MTQTATPDNGLPDAAQTITKDYVFGSGETITAAWKGKKSDVEDKYEEAKGDAEAGANIAQATFTNSDGRAGVVIRYNRTGVDIAGNPEDVAVIEELYAVDVLKDIDTADYFAVTVSVPKGLPLDDDEVAFVRKVSSMNLTETEITSYSFRVAKDALGKWANWTTGMKELRYHLLRGADTYYETGFILRRSRHGIRTSVIEASFAGINTVVTAPTFQSPMDALIASLPTGEWLLRPPQANFLGRGKWRIDEEWQYATKWSIVYGGTWNL